MAEEQAAAAGKGAQPTAFLSYSRADQARAQVLAEALEAAGLKVWWDRMIEGGAAFAKTIEAALVSSDAVIVLWSKQSVASDWVLDEAAHGRDLRKLVPLSLDGTEAPLGFRQYQSISLAAWRGPADPAPVAAIVRAVRALASGDATVQRVAPTPVASPSRRRALLGAAIAAAVVATGGGWLAWQRGLFATPAAALGNSLAVLPFENISGDPKQAYFSDGLSEEVRATLARNLRLRVMAQTSSSQFRTSDNDATHIAKQLGVAFLLDGSVRRAGESVRVAVDLIDGRTGFSRWSQIFERLIDDVFAVQSEIANAVAVALAAEVDVGAGPADPAAERAASGGTAIVAAFDAYLRGRALYDLSVDEASERAALAQFDAALSLDPDYAAAHAARARSLTTLANQYAALGEHEALYAQAIAAAERAIALAPDFAGAHSTLAFILFQGKLDARAARAPFERSNALGAGDATVQARWAQFCARTGRHDEAAAAIERALQRDPLNPLIHRAAGTIAYAARAWSESIPPLRKALAMNPRMSRAHAAIGDAMVNLGDLGAARAEYLAEPSDTFRLSGLAILEHRQGNVAAARTAMQALVDQTGDLSLYQQALVLAQWGEREAAIERLLKSRAAGDSGLIYARNDPFLDPVRADPRVAGLLAGLGFDPA
jgi:TolB-like protein/Tfp pilus assembly protein PilF